MAVLDDSPAEKPGLVPFQDAFLFEAGVK